MKILFCALALSPAVFATSDITSKALLNSAVASAPPVEYEKWFPLCLMVEEGAGNTTKQIAEDLTRQAARCQVNLFVKMEYVNKVPADAAAAAAAAANHCNAIDAFKKDGVDRTAAILVTAKRGLAKEMCGGKVAERVGCAQYPKEPDKSLKQRMQAIGAYAEPAAKEGKAAAAIVEGGTDALGEVQRWGMGIAMMGLGLGPSAGNGVGKPDESASGNEKIEKPGWLEYGCERMRAMAFPNKRHIKTSVSQTYPEGSQTPVDITDNKKLAFLVNSKDVVTQAGKPPGSGSSGGTPPINDPATGNPNVQAQEVPVERVKGSGLRSGAALAEESERRSRIKGTEGGSTQGRAGTNGLVGATPTAKPGSGEAPTEDVGITGHKQNAQGGLESPAAPQVSGPGRRGR